MGLPFQIEHAKIRMVLCVSRARDASFSALEGCLGLADKELNLRGFAGAGLPSPAKWLSHGLATAAPRGGSSATLTGR